MICGKQQEAEDDLRRDAFQVGVWRRLASVCLPRPLLFVCLCRRTLSIPLPVIFLAAHSFAAQPLVSIINGCRLILARRRRAALLSRSNAMRTNPQAGEVLKKKESLFFCVSILWRAKRNSFSLWGQKGAVTFVSTSTRLAAQSLQLERYRWY